MSKKITEHMVNDWLGYMEAKSVINLLCAVLLGEWTIDQLKVHIIEAYEERAKI